MKKNLKKIALSIFIVLFVVQPNLGQEIKSHHAEHHDRCTRQTEKNHRSHDRNTVYKKSTNLSNPSNNMKRAKAAEDCATPVSELANYSVANLIASLKQRLDYDCHRPMWNFEKNNSSKLYQSDKINAVAQEIINIAPNYNGKKSYGLTGLLLYLRTLTYHEFYENSLTLTNQNINLLSSAVVALASNPNISSFEEENLSNLGELLTLSDYPGIMNQPVVIDLIKYVLEEITVRDNWRGIDDSLTFDYGNTANAIFSVLFRIDQDDDFAEVFRNDLELIELLGNLAIDADLNSAFDGYFSFIVGNAATIYTRAAEFFPEVMQDGLIAIINHYDRLDVNWLMAMETLYKNGDCSVVSCENPEDLKTELIDRILGNIVQYDDQKIIVNSPLSYEKVQNLYFAAKEVRANFFNLLGTDQPVVGDENDVLNIYVFGSYEEYQQYAGYLFGIDTNNGGMYLEGISTFYTWDREVPRDSSLTLESLFRHEYVHYLQGRYLIPGFWGDSEIYQNSRLVWYEEGMAEFFAGSTDTKGTKLLEQSGTDVANTWPSDWPTLDTVFNSSYSDGEFYHYTYGNMIWYYWYLNNPSIMNEFFEATRNNNVQRFDQLIADNRYSLEGEYRAFLTDVADGTIESWDPNTNWIPNDQLTKSTIEDIENEFIRVTGITNIAVSYEAQQTNKRFQIIGNLTTNESAISNSNSNQLHLELQELLKKLETESAINSFDVAVGYIRNQSEAGFNQTGEFVITGPINNTITTPITTKPNITFTSHENGSTVVAGENTRIQATITHNRSIVSAELKLNNQSLGIITNQNYQWDVSSNDMQEGTLNFELVAIDDQGTSNVQTLWLESKAETTTPIITKPTITFTSHENGSTVVAGENTRIQATITHNRSIVSAELKLNNQSLGIITNQNYQWDVSSNDIQEGALNFELIAIDDQGISTVETLWLEGKVETIIPDTPDIPTDYCTAKNTLDGVFIKQVSFGTDIFKNSTSSGYADNTDLIIKIKQGESSTFTIVTSNDWWDYNDLGVWIDWNSDGDFNDPQESVYEHYGTGPYRTISFSVPETAKEGFSRIRVRYAYGAEDAAQPCGTDDYYGEVEDYGIQILPNTSTPTTPPPPVTENNVYCDATNTESDSYIQQVRIGTLINETSGHTGYSNNTDQILSIEKGEESTFTVVTSNDWWDYNDIGIWIDWNNDGDFNDPQESVYEKYGPGPYTNIAFSVPETAKEGLSRIRIRYSYGAEDAAQPCGKENYFGEVEDYGIQILPSTGLKVNSGILKVFPNPANQNVTLEETNLTGAIVELFTLNGILLKTEIANSNSHKINVNSYSTGLYILKVTKSESLESTVVKLFIK